MGSKSIKDLVPGDPEQVWQLADFYDRMARRCEDGGRGFRAIDDGGWRGAAREAFHARVGQQPRRLLAMADAYGHTAVALDTYAAVLAWTQRQAGEVIALDDSEDQPAPPAPKTPALTAAQQAELTGVITVNDEPTPEPNRGDQRGLALSTFHRALAMLDTVGGESAAAIKAATELMPAATEAPPPTLDTTPPQHAPNALPKPAANIVVHAVLPAPKPRTWFDPTTLRDDPQAWPTAIKELRKRLRWHGLNRLSPRFAQHIFEGHYRPSRAVHTGYHHREDGVDQGALRVVEIIEGPDPHGVYAGLVRGPHTPPTKTKKSTFFPDSWTRAEVLYAVRQVFLDAMRDKDKYYNPAKRRFRGVYRGVEIVGHLQQGTATPKLCDVVTAYPRGVQRRRQE